MNYSKITLAIILLFTPNFALASQNTPEMIAFASIGMLLIAGFVIFAAMKADEAANDPTDANYATAENIIEKLEHQLNAHQKYSLSVVRQSGNIERTVDDLTATQVCKQISQTMKRAKIDAVSIRRNDEAILINRTMHNGRGRQEGKRIGGFVIVPSVFESINSDIGDDTFALETFGLPDENDMRIHPENEAQKAIVKAFMRAYEHFDEYPIAFAHSYDPETGEGDELFHPEAVVNFLIIADAYLVGKGDLTEEVRSQMAASDAEWQKNIASDLSRTEVIGAMSFSNTDLKSIQIALRSWWEESSNKAASDPSSLSISMLMSPKFLDMDFNDF